MKLSTDKIRAEVEGGIGWLTFNQPERRNAMSMEMWQGVGDAMEAFQHDPEVRVVVMKGAGGKAFVSGADISEFDQHRASAEQRKVYAETNARGNRWLRRLDKPLVAMIEGFCIGGGLAVALTADVRIATPESQFGIPAAKLGLGYDFGGLATLARLVGPSVARDILFSARFLPAEEALRVGLINRIVPAEELESEVRAYAGLIAANAPLTIRAAKAAMQEFERDPASRDLARVEAMVNACFDSDDYKEGRRAFAEKRRPAFTGR
ncbi:MAG: enoyl-CoA hydratase/isomerase family protein [Chloroflexi bacterium]|nr:enoyl-CoA hydratase/isomerase family protein [Chloroflexota bacterium]